MKLIPHLEYEKLISSNSGPKFLRKSAYVNQLNRNQEAASQLLVWDNVSDDIKLALFNTAMKGLREKFVALTEEPVLVEISKNSRPLNSTSDQESLPSKLSSRNVGTATSNESVDKNLLHILPERIRLSASKVMESLRKPKLQEVSWDASGQISFKGKKRNGANIIDLMSYVLKPPSKTKKPIGLVSFVFALKKLKIDPNLFGIHIKKMLSMSLPALFVKKTPMRFPKMDEGGSTDDELDEEKSDDIDDEEWADASLSTPAYAWESYKK